MKLYPENFDAGTPVEHDGIFDLVKIEEIKQRTRWGAQNLSLFEWDTILAEEVGELAKAIMEHDYRGGKKAAIIHEAVQVAMIACKIAKLADEHGKD